MDALAATGARLARALLPLEWDPLQGRYAWTPADLSALRRIDAWSRERGIGLVVVADFPLQDEEGFWQSSRLQDAAVDLWARLAREMPQPEAIVGWDLLNEPNPRGADATGRRKPIDVWRSLGQRMVEAIRAGGSKITVVYEPVAGASAAALEELEPLSDDNVVYSIHFYTPHEITHQGVARQWSREIPYPAGPEWGRLDGADYAGFGRGSMARELQAARAFQARCGAGIYVGEFSCVRWAPDDSALRYVTDCLDLFEAFGWSWTYHEFRGWPGWDPEIATRERRLTGLSRNSDAPLIRMLRERMQGQDRRGAKA